MTSPTQESYRFPPLSSSSQQHQQQQSHQQHQHRYSPISSSTSSPSSSSPSPPPPLSLNNTNNPYNNPPYHNASMSASDVRMINNQTPPIEQQQQQHSRRHTMNHNHNNDHQFYTTHPQQQQQQQQQPFYSTRQSLPSSFVIKQPPSSTTSTASSHQRQHSVLHNSSVPPLLSTTNHPTATSTTSSSASSAGTATATATTTTTSPSSPMINEQQLRKFCQMNLSKLIPLSHQLEDTINYWYQQNFRQHPVRVLLQKGPFYWTRLLYRRFMSWSRRYLFSDEQSSSALSPGSGSGGIGIGGGGGGGVGASSHHHHHHTRLLSEPPSPLYSPTSTWPSGRLFSPIREEMTSPFYGGGAQHSQQPPQHAHTDQKIQQIVTAKQDLNHTLYELQKWSKLNAELIGISSQILKELNRLSSPSSFYFSQQQQQQQQRRFSTAVTSPTHHQTTTATTARMPNDHCMALLNEMIQFFQRNRHLYEKSTLFVNANGPMMISQCGKFIDEHVYQIQKHVLPLYKQPNHLTRNWIKYTFGISAVSFLAYKVATNRDEIEHWVQESYDSVLRFYILHLQEPIVNMYNVIRYDTHKQLIDPESVNVSVNSLERMVTRFAQDHGSSDGRLFSGEELQIVAQQARSGNLDYIMHKYEREMTNPLKNALFGDMAQLLLIQVQKQKVDIERTMVQMDKLMQSNELNFELMATVPAVLLAVFVVYNVLTYQRKTDMRVFTAFKSSLVQTERVLNRFPKNEQESVAIEASQYIEQQESPLGIKSGDIDEASAAYNFNQACGFVHLHVSKMRKLLNTNINKFQTHYRREASVARDLHFDLTELNDHQMTPAQRLRTIERMYRSYYFLHNNFIQNQE